jgi:hypothetical protein
VETTPDPRQRRNPSNIYLFILFLLLVSHHSITRHAVQLHGSVTGQLPKDDILDRRKQRIRGKKYNIHVTTELTSKSRGIKTVTSALKLTTHPTTLEK